MLHLALALPLLAAPPTLVERLRLGVVPEATQVRPYGATVGESVAGAGGVAIGHAAAVLVMSQQEGIFRECDGDFCRISPLLYVSLLVSELVIAPGSAAGLANLVSRDPHGQPWRAYGFATLVHVGGLALTIPAFLVGGSSENLALALLAVAAVVDSALTGTAASYFLHDHAAPTVEAAPPDVSAPPEPPQLQPPPHAQRALTVPLAFAF